MRDFFIIDRLHHVFYYDAAYYYARPMTYYVESPQEIDNIFDDMTYSKGK